MSEPFIGEIKMFSYNFPPRTWALCNGQLLAINQNQALFSLLGTTYGGNGTTNFALPNFQGRTPISRGSSFVQGQTSGVENVTLLIPQLPSHTHILVASSNGPAQGSPNGSYLSTFTSDNAYIASSNTAMGPTGATGGNQGHPNIQPTLVISFCIALQGIFPSRN